MDFVIRKGLDLKIAGEATDTMLENILSDTIYVCPGDFRWLQPKLLVNAGDTVRVGTPLFCDKQDERIVVVSPVAGIVKEIVRGEKRVVQYVAISRDAEAPTHLQVPFDEPSDGRAIRALLLQHGLWSSLRQRPFAVIPNPDVRPKSVFVPCFDSNPLAPDYSILLRGQEDSFLRGLQILQMAAEDAPMHLCMRKGADNALFERANNVGKQFNTVTVNIKLFFCHLISSHPLIPISR